MSYRITYLDTWNMFHDTKAITLQKILQVLNGAGTGGGGTSIFGTLQVFADRRPANPDDVTKAALNIDSATGTIQQWVPPGPWT